MTFFRKWRKNPIKWQNPVKWQGAPNYSEGGAFENVTLSFPVEYWCFMVVHTHCYNIMLISISADCKILVFTILKFNVNLSNWVRYLLCDPSYAKRKSTRCRKTFEDQTNTHFSCFFTVRNSSCRKVMLLQASGGGMCGREGCAWKGVCVARGCMPGEGHAMQEAYMAGGMHGRGWGMCGRRDGHCSGRYASDWNAFLF